MAHILIVDDSALSRRILRRILEGVGHRVAEAEDGIVALERYFLTRPDLVLLDLTMPDMHGLDVLTKLRSLDPQAQVIVVTADIQSSTQELAHAGGAVGFVTKPLNAENVLAAVNAVLSQEGMADAMADYSPPLQRGGS
jgi:two-component system chemotaxis response regulator CheY